MADVLPVAAQTLAQDTHIIRSPSPRRDIAPSTAADKKIRHRRRDADGYHDIDLSDDEDNAPSISSSIVNFGSERRTRKQLPPLPDLRFEQSYLASIAPAQGVWWKIALITLKDQIMMPLMQGLLYNLMVVGWRAWNRGARFSGAGVGARVRRWWWGVNNWEIPRRQR